MKTLHKSFIIFHLMIPFLILINCSIEEDPFFFAAESFFNEDSPIQFWVAKDCDLSSLQSQISCYRNEEKFFGKLVEKEIEKNNKKGWYRLLEISSEEEFLYGDIVRIKIKGLIQYERKQLIPTYQEMLFFYRGKRIPLYLKKESSPLLQSTDPILLSLSMPILLTTLTTEKITALLSINNSFHQEVQTELERNPKSNSYQLTIKPVSQWNSIGKLHLFFQSDFFQLLGDKKIEVVVQNRETSQIQKAFWKITPSNEVVFQLNWTQPIQIGDLYSHCFFTPPLEGKWEKQEGVNQYYFLPSHLEGVIKEYQFTLLKGVKNLHTGLPSSDQIEKKNYPMPPYFLPKIVQIQWSPDPQHPTVEILTIENPYPFHQPACYDYKIAPEEALSYRKRLILDSNFYWNRENSNELLNAIRIFPIMPDSGINLPQKRLIGFTPDQRRAIVEIQFSKIGAIPFPLFYSLSIQLSHPHFKEAPINSQFKPIHFYLKEVIE